MLLGSEWKVQKSATKQLQLFGTCQRNESWNISRTPCELAVPTPGKNERALGTSSGLSINGNSTLTQAMEIFHCMLQDEPDSQYTHSHSLISHIVPLPMSAACLVSSAKLQLAELCPCPSCVLGRTADERARLCSKIAPKPTRPGEHFLAGASAAVHRRLTRANSTASKVCQQA